MIRTVISKRLLFSTRICAVTHLLHRLLCAALFLFSGCLGGLLFSLPPPKATCSRSHARGRKRILPSTAMPLLSLLFIPNIVHDLPPRLRRYNALPRYCPGNCPFPRTSPRRTSPPQRSAAIPFVAGLGQHSEMQQRAERQSHMPLQLDVRRRSSTACRTSATGARGTVASGT